MEDAKIIVNAKGEKLLLGSDFHVLEDFTKAKFVTNSLEDFINNLSEYPGSKEIYISDYNISAYFDITDVDYYTKPIAICKLETHPIVTFLKHINKSQQNLQGFQLTIERLKKYMLQESLILRDNLSDLKIKKVISIENQNDRRGNFAFSVRAEKIWKQDYEFPKIIKLNIPSMKFIDITIDLELELYFKWAVNEDASVNLEFTLENMELDDIIERGQRNIIKEQLKEAGFEEIYFGSIDITQQTDSWKYKENKINI